MNGIASCSHCATPLQNHENHGLCIACAMEDPSLECSECGTALTIEKSDWYDGLCGPCKAEEDREGE